MESRLPLCSGVMMKVANGTDMTLKFLSLGSMILVAYAALLPNPPDGTYTDDDALKEVAMESSSEAAPPA